MIFLERTLIVILFSMLALAAHSALSSREPETMEECLEKFHPVDCHMAHGDSK